MDNDFDGFMKTLGGLSDKHDASSSFDVDIDDLLSSEPSPSPKSPDSHKHHNEASNQHESLLLKPIDEDEQNENSKIVDSQHSGEFASMHTQFMESLKEIKDLQISHDSNDHHTPQESKVITPKISELNTRGSLDSRVDAELQQLLETGTCSQQEPEQNDTVELSISDDENANDHANGSNDSESEIILQNIDDLESIKSGHTLSVMSSPRKVANEHNISKRIKQDTNAHAANASKLSPTPKNAESNVQIASPSHLESESDSDCNQPEYDLVSFGIKEANTPRSQPPKSSVSEPAAAGVGQNKPTEDDAKQTNASNANADIYLRSSLPSSSSFESNAKQKQNNKNDENDTENSKDASTASSAQSKKSVLSKENRGGLKKLKEKIKSDKKKKPGRSVESTPYKTPINQKTSFIQTPRHSLRNSRANSKASSLASSPSKHVINEQLVAMQNEVKDKEETIKQLKDKLMKSEQAHQEIQKQAETKVQTAEAQVFALECKLKGIEEKHKNKTCSVVAGDDDGDISEDTEINKQGFASMKKEMVEMDRIIKSLNEENAKLSQQLKQKQIDLRQSQQLMYKENQKINDSLACTQHQLSEMQEKKIEDLQPAAFNEIQKLRKQLQSEQEISTARERELGLEIGRLKEENRDLQFKLDGIDKRTFENESDLLQQFKSEALKLQQKSQDQINELKRKLTWYIENQELIENLNRQIQQKNDEIISLKSRSTSPAMLELERKPEKKPSANQHRQIVALKKRVKDLEKLLAAKHPDSIANNLISLMHGANHNDDQAENIIIEQLREQIDFLQEQLDHKEDETLARLRALRQQHDKVQLQLNNKVKSLQQQITKSKREKGFVRPNTRIKELEQQIEDLKQTHSKKMKALKDKHMAQIRREQQERFAGNQASSNANDRVPHDKVDGDEQRSSKLEEELEQKSQEIERLQTRLEQKQSIIENLKVSMESQKETQQDLQEQIALLQVQLKNALKPQQVAAAQQVREEESVDNDCKMDEPLQVIPTQHMRKEDEIEEEEEDLEKQSLMEKEKIYVERIKILESEINEYKRQCAILSEKIELEKSKGEQSVKAMQNQLEWSKLEHERSQQLISKLQFELNHAKNTPSFVEYEQLLLKLEKIEQRGNAREQELEQTYMRLLQSNDDLEEKLTNKYEGILSSKNHEIVSLQQQLTALMAAFEKLKST
eukprot:CAMPEP_0197077688 /NCGR_PEP_ID=MMETSP1384-20130603/212744_1 /TAXON_ID=29189 /ORGANISM="Ammonia sp." /LENGTH=1185 /DNA_ID=CAMNT_0042516553 /DNA_START=13 /DNA_END=3570 /DNA_ORIENTATION=+